MTDRYHIGAELLFFAADARVNFDDLTDRFYEELLKLEEVDRTIIDPDIAVDLKRQTVVVELSVDADRLIDAQLHGMASIRTALHAIEVGTPGWEAEFASIMHPRELQDA